MKENTAAADCYPQCKPPAEESRLERRGHVHRDTDLMVKAVKIHQDGNEDEKELKKQMELKQTNKMRRSLVLWTSEDKDLSPGCIPEGHEDKEKPVSDYNSSVKHISVSSERETSEVLSQSLDERAEEPHSVRTVELTRDEQVTAEVKADFEIRIKDKWTTVSLTNTTDEKESDLSRAQQRHGQGQMSGEEIKETSIKDSESMIPHMDRGSPSKAGSLKYLTSDPRVKDSGKLNTEEKQQMLKRVSQSETVLLTLVFQDGRTQLEPEQKVTAPVCGLMMLIIWKVLTPSERSTDSLGPNDSLVYLKLHKQKPAWVQHSTIMKCGTSLCRDVLLQVLSRPGLVVCYKAKDFLRTVLQFYEDELTWKQVAGCHIQDPQVSGWLLDPADPSSCFHDLLNKHCKKYTPSSTPGARPVSTTALLHKHNIKVHLWFRDHGLWELYSHMELNMIPVLRPLLFSPLLSVLQSKMKQLEQEAHRAAGQTFLITSNTQLRTVLFEKLRLDLLCENKKLPKTINKQQSTSEALLQLQDLHPLPKIILEYRQVIYLKKKGGGGVFVILKELTNRIMCRGVPQGSCLVPTGKVEEVVTVHPRAMFIPQKGWTFLAADFCQVELRLLAHLSSDPELLRIFTEPQADVFTLLASQWKGLSECDVTPEDREQAKRMVYSVVYGAGRERLSGILGVSSDQARQFQDRFLQTYREVQAFIQKTIQICHKQGYVLSIMGRRRSLPHIRSPDWATRMQAERQAVNFTLHDELLYEVEDSQVEEFAGEFTGPHR
uniref:Polymerase (DNA directed) nu n=1 Tax=Cynoglossus semilaevis TaxID=244447 RepID=A0A3P8V2N6_CYNSE